MFPTCFFPQFPANDFFLINVAHDDRLMAHEPVCLSESKMVMEMAAKVTFVFLSGF